ncbi:MAG: 3-hydroxyacyl-CoA dehydrogenase NAD-binding domain-containing protein, partial [Bradymonadia bacterium]
PVVAAINGSALGGGYEVALACHHRIAMAGSGKIGLPEVSLGLLPGGGGCQRLPRLIGIQPALEVIAQGQMLRVDKALKKGLVDAVASDKTAMLAEASDWIKANPRAKQPWDQRGFEFPGGVQPETDAGRNLFAGGAAMLLKKTAGAYAAPQAAVQAVYEGCHVGFDAALKIESRYFASLVASDQSKDMIRTFWYHKNEVDKQASLPRTESEAIQKVGILGAGMMGAGLAFICAKAGYNVVLKDIRQDALDKGMAHCEAQGKKRLKYLPLEEREAVMNRITGSLELGSLEGCDLIIEAVVEDIDVKHAVTREVEGILAPNAIFASNTSALPITDLAQAAEAKDRFIGLHFFSPVEQMPLLEIIKGRETSDETLARCLMFAKKIKKTSIVVNDGYGFYTTRLFSSYVMEAAQLVAEGFSPVLVERAARRAGMVISPLKVFDEVTLSLAEHGFRMREAYTGEALKHDGVDLVRAMVEAGRLGKAAGAGFYEYKQTPRTLWEGLGDLAKGPQTELTGEAQLWEAEHRLMSVQAVEAVRCLEEGILNSKADAEIGAIFGLGFAPNTGGPLAWIDRFGISETVELLNRLAQTLDTRYAPPQQLVQMAENNERFYPWV